MKRSELKEILRPIVKECVQESVQQLILESGLLTSVITEVMKGLGTTSRLVENQSNQTLVVEDDRDDDMNMMRRKALDNSQRKKLLETKKQLLDNVGNTGYKNIFEGIKETIPDEVTSTPGNPLAGIAANDPGVDISGFIDPDKIRALVNGKRK